MTAIARLEVEDFLRLRSVDITPAPGEPVEITGRNAQGKTSILRAIEATLGGKSAVPTEAVREGAGSGWTRVQLDSGVTVERRYKGGTATLHVTGPDGAKIGRPQEELNALLGALTFEPLKFRESTPAAQRATLARLVGIDLAAVEAERDQVFRARRDVNRDVTRLTGTLASLPKPEADLPVEPVDLGELLGVLRVARETVAANEAKRHALDAMRTERSDIRMEIERLTQRMALIDEEIAIEGPAVAALQDPDLADLEQQVAEIGTVNDQVRAAQEHGKAKAVLQEQERESARLTAELARIDAETRERIEAADLPVAGLDFADTGITFNGQPFDQASAAESIRVCFAVAAAERPGLNIALIRDGSLLDDESLALITAEAASAGCQLWIERVGSAGGFVIEDGEVAERPSPEGVLGGGW